MENDNETTIDARPAFPVSLDSLWDRAAKNRENIVTIIESEFKQRNIIAWIRKSQPGEYPLYVAVDSWIPKGETQRSVTLDRNFFKVVISVDPCRVHPLTYKVELDRQGRKFNGEHWELDEAELRELVVYTLQGGKKPKFLRPRLSIIGRIFYSFFPFWDPTANKLISEARPNIWTLPFLLGSTGAFALLLSFLNGMENILTEQLPFTLFGAAALTATTLLVRRRETIEVIPKRSMRSPRREFRVDSWHVSVPDAGKEFEQFRKRIYNVIRIKEPDIEMGVELHQRFTNSRGLEARERLVLTKGQTTLHVHVYPFENDAFVGWESYLNWNCWVETAPISQTVRNGMSLNYRSLDVGVYLPTDFDLIEADVLAETTHRVIVDEIKAFLKEKEIEADLDFTIIRGDRANALKEGKNDKDKKKGWLN